MHQGTLLVAGIALVAVGCSSAEPNRIEGKVLLNGEPAPGVQVVLFDAEQSTRDPVAAGQTDAHGAFTLVQEHGFGFRPGRWKTVVLDTPPPFSTKPIERIVPARYWKREESPLWIEFSDWTGNLPTIDLVSEPRDREALLRSMTAMPSPLSGAAPGNSRAISQPDAASRAKGTE